MNLAHKLLNNPGLIALTVLAEQKEIVAPIVPPGARHRKIKFAFMQKGFGGPDIPMWHVDWVGTDTETINFGTTLAMDGLKQWHVL